MSLTLWRVVKHRYRSEAMTGEGTRIHGGRWSSPGLPIIYLSQHLSLAILEILVHTERTAMLSGYDQVSLMLQENQIQGVAHIALPDNWNAPFPASELQTIGDNWFKEGTTVALEVPSAILPQEKNYLINPEHKDFFKPQISAPETIALDPRLFVS